MIGVNALTLRARLVKPHNQIDTGFIRLINEPAVVGRPQFRAITGVHFMTGIALWKTSSPDCSQISWRASAYDEAGIGTSLPAGSST